MTTQAIGSVFADRFELLRQLGQGSMGIVYRARDRQSGVECALKVMKAGMLSSPKSRRRFEREAEAGLLIQSAYVVRTLATGVEAKSGLPWTAMEIVEGSTLEEFVGKRAPLPHPLAGQILGQIFDAVAAAHDVGIVHRDLKPENIVVEELEGGAIRAVVLDFGVAKLLHGATGHQTDAGLGTPLWTAPEQAKDGWVPDPVADVWALGLVAFFVFAGQIYWEFAGERGSLLDLSMELLRGEIAPASKRAEHLRCPAPLPPGFDAWFASAVNRDPKRRYPTAGAALDALVTTLNGTVEIPVFRKRAQAKSRAWIGLAVLLLVVGGAVGAWWVMR